METFDYRDRFREALQQAFAAGDPAVRVAYFELASFYREKICGSVPTQPSAELMKRNARRSRAKAKQAGAIFRCSAAGKG
jgi:hypothetical protein